MLFYFFNIRPQFLIATIPFVSIVSFVGPNAETIVQYAVQPSPPNTALKILIDILIKWLTNLTMLLKRNGKRLSMNVQVRDLSARKMVIDKNTSE